MEGDGASENSGKRGHDACAWRAAWRYRRRFWYR